MGTVQIQDIIVWAIAIVGASLVSLIGGIISIVKATKLVNKEVYHAELDNKDKTADVIAKYEDSITKANDRADKILGRLEAAEASNERLRLVVEENTDTIQKQSCLIEDQRKRQDAQELKARDQEREMAMLKFDLENAKRYVEILINQMKANSIIPLDAPVVNMKKYLEDELAKIRESEKVFNNRVFDQVTGNECDNLEKIQPENKKGGINPPIIQKRRRNK